MKVRVEQFALPLGTPLETAAGTVEERAGVLVVVSDGATTGAGEATPIRRSSASPRLWITMKAAPVLAIGLALRA